MKEHSQTYSFSLGNCLFLSCFDEQSEASMVKSLHTDCLNPRVSLFFLQKPVELLSKFGGLSHQLIVTTFTRERRLVVNQLGV